VKLMGMVGREQRSMGGGWWSRGIGEKPGHQGGGLEPGL
jgi:hypothetical protein